MTEKRLDFFSVDDLSLFTFIVEISVKFIKAYLGWFSSTLQEAFSLVEYNN